MSSAHPLGHSLLSALLKEVSEGGEQEGFNFILI